MPSTLRRGPLSRPVFLSKTSRAKLEALVRQPTQPYCVVLRAKIILGLSRDPCVEAISKRLGTSVKSVRKWRDRFLKTKHVDSLYDKPRSGRPPLIDVVTRCEIVAMACGRPADFGAPFRHTWTLNTLRDRFLKTHPNAHPVSRTSVFRTLNDLDMRPHRVRLWLHSPDPLFREKVTRICALYTNLPKDAIVLCVDEKTGMQALGRKHPLRIAKPGRDGRMESEYIRNGTRKLIAALNPHTGEVYGEMRAHRKIPDTIEFMENLAKRFPDKTVYIVWDNLNTHLDGPEKRWTAFNARHGNRFRFVYTPIHASWVNQVELFFGILHKRLLRYGVYNSLKELDEVVNGFLAHWNKYERHPFAWKFKGYPLQAGKRAA